MAIAATLDIEPHMQRCIDDCLECHAVCERTASHCLQMGGKHASRQHQTALRDCAEACATAANFMIRESPLHAATCAACAEACAVCAEECERLAGEDRMMLHCAETCRRCEQSCREMAQVGKSAYTR